MPATRPLLRTGEPGIFKRGNRYVVIYRDGLGRQRKQSARTMKEARDLKASVRVEPVMDAAASRERFRTYALRWIDNYAGRSGRGVREETRTRYRRDLERDAIPFLGNLQMGQIRQKHLSEFADHIAGRGLEAASVRGVLAPVKALLADAFAAGDIRANPASGWRTRHTLRSQDVTSDAVKALTETQLEVVLREIPEEWRLFYTLLAQTGLRISEAIELRWKDIDFGSRRVQIARRFYEGRVAPPKTKYGRRTIKLSQDVARALWPLQGDPDGLVFTTTTGQRVDQSNVMSRVLKPAAVRAGVGKWIKTPGGKRAESWVGHHTFRHTCATLLFKNGWNAKQVQVWLGHHSPAFTLETYVHLLTDDLPELPDSFVMGGNKGATQGAETAGESPSLMETNCEANPHETAVLLGAVRSV